MWDLTAYQVTIKAIGTVESSFDYGAINPTDPISVGVAQWYATRASAVLRKMRTQNPADWASLVGSRLDTDLNNHSDTDNWWTSRYLTSREILDLRPVLRATANKAVQDQQMVDDIDNDYLPECAAVGINKDTNTMTAEYYMVMYHQSPRSARRVINAVGGSASLDKLHAATLNDSVLGDYKTRYNTAYNIIKNQDTSGVGTGIEIDGDVTGDSGGIITRPVSDAAYIAKVGNDMHLIMKNGDRHIFRHSSPKMYIAPFDSSIGAAPVVDPDDSTSGGTSNAPGALGDIINWLLTHVNDFDYSQGSGRLTPETSGYTDCSGLMYHVFKKFANINIGTYTGNQYNKGQTITTNKAEAAAGTGMLPGDLVFFNWSGNQTSTHPYNHVDMYLGSNQGIGHGGPDPGPDTYADFGARINSAAFVRVQRYISP